MTDTADPMEGIMGISAIMMRNLHTIAKRNCECATLAKETLIMLGDSTYKQIDIEINT